MSYQAAIALGSAAFVEVFKIAGRVRSSRDEAECLQRDMCMLHMCMCMCMCVVGAWHVHGMCMACAWHVHGTSPCSGLQLVDDDKLDHISAERDGVEDQCGLGVAAEARVVPARREEVHRARLLMVRAEAWLGGWLGPGCKAAWVWQPPG